jgi:UDP-N-acetylmuramoyl-tripeptide--D-alanyl-D-alanine ligase
MTTIWTSESLSKALQINVPSNIKTSVVQFNSKDITPGDLFIALRGSTDGHLYAKDAISRGASAVILDHEGDGIDGSKIIMVQNTQDALLKLAKYKRYTSKAKFIGVTGSSGKTSTKDAIHHVLKSFGPSFASRSTFNNHIGVPLNLASMPDNIQYAVLEMGMDHAGEIEYLSRLVEPDIALITNVFPVHLGSFDTVQDIADAKCEVFKNMKDNSIVILSKDSKYYEYCLNKTSKKITYSFGETEDADSRLLSYIFDGKTAHLKFNVANQHINISTGLAGKHMAQNLSAVLMIINVLGLDLEKAATSISGLSPLSGRGKILHTKISGHNCDVIYDSYNASPPSVQSSLEHLKDMTHNNKVVVLGDMCELGPTAVQYYKALVPFVVDSGAKCLYTVGELMKHLYDELRDKMHCEHFVDSDDIGQALPSLIDKDSLILFKGANRMKLSKIVEDLINKA